MELEEELYERLGILERGGLITGQVAEYCKKVIRLVLAERPEADEEKFAMFITHLAMAVQRMREGREESPIGTEVLEAVKAEAAYPKAAEFSEKLMEEADIEFSQTERDFLRVHLCNLFS